MKFILLILYSLKYCKKFHLLLSWREWHLFPVFRFHVLDFKPYSHEGSDYFISRIIRRGVISIHTPTKGVTSSQIWDTYLYGISIHTPTKGVTYLWICNRFSSQISIHTPTKGVTLSSSFSVPKVSISIHTPTKGVTILSQKVFSTSSDFNPHSHKGSDWLTSIMMIY